MAEKRERVDAALDMLLNHAPADEPKTYTTAEARRQVRQSTREAEAEENPYDRETMKANRKRDSQENILAKLGIDRPHKRLWNDDQYAEAVKDAKLSSLKAHRKQEDDANEIPKGQRIENKVRLKELPLFPGSAEPEKTEPKRLVNVVSHQEIKERK